MSIEFTCVGCGYSRDVPNDFALKTVTCPKCKEKGIVPEPSTRMMISEVIDIEEDTGPPRPRGSEPTIESPLSTSNEAKDPGGHYPHRPFPERNYWRFDRRRQRSIKNGVVLFVLQVVFIVPYIIMESGRLTQSHKATTSDALIEIVAFALSFMAAISYLVTPFWIASHSKGRGAETPLWCIVGLTPLLGLAMYLIANSGVDLD